MIKLKQLRDISGDIAKKKFLNDNKNDREFVECLKFLLDDLVITNISSKKYDKILNLEPTQQINNVFELMDYLRTSSGKDIDIVNIKNFINQFTGDEKEILEGLVCKNYVVDFGTKFFNQVMKKDGIVKSPYMGCQPFSEKKVRKLFEENITLCSQVKNDGQFLNSIVTKNKVNFTARSGLVQYINGKLEEELTSMRKLANFDFVLTGELLVDGYDRQTANGLIRSLISSNKKILDGDLGEAEKFQKKYEISIEDIESKLRLVVWDIVNYNGFLKGIDFTTYFDRLGLLEYIIAESESNMVRVTEYKIVGSYKEAIQHFKELLARGEEGSVIKTLNDEWKDGKPSYMIKMKLEMEIDLKIVGFNPGKPKTKYEHTLGSLQVQSEDGLLFTNMSGISDETRDEIWSNKENYFNKIVVVKCNGVSTNREGGTSLLYPNYIEIRDDKINANTLPEILEIEKMKLELGQ